MSLEVKRAYEKTRLDIFGLNINLDRSIEVVIVLLTNLKSQIAGWSFWKRWALGLVISLLKEAKGKGN